MRAIIQRVSEASVEIDKVNVSEIKKGFMILIAFENEDTEEDLIWLANKITKLRVFGDEDGKMNLSINDINGEILLVSQFTLFASTKKGNRPSFMKSAKPEIAIPLYEQFISLISKIVTTKTGKFGSDMKVSLVNDGPVTIQVDTKNKE